MEACSDLLQLVTKRMSKSIVHFLEVIEVEAKNAKPWPRANKAK
jgi:hypothetical protein